MEASIKEIAEGFAQKASAFEEYKKANDVRLENLEKGLSTSDQDAKLANIEKAIAETNEKLKSFEIKSGRSRIGIPDQGTAEYKAGFELFMRKGDTSEIETKSVNLGSGDDGGLAVPEELDRNIIQLLGKETPMREVCSIMPVGTNGYKKLANIGGAGYGWVGETDERPETDTPKLAQIEAFMGEIYANPAVTQTALDDIFFDVESWLSSEVLIAFSEAENEAFTFGNGVKKAKGFLSYPQSEDKDADRPFGTLQTVNSGEASAISSDGLINIIHSAKRGYRRNAVFMLNNLTLANIRKLKDNEGNYLWQPGLQLDQPDRLLGYGIVENDDMPDIAMDSAPLAFGDFKRGYLIVDRIGTRVLRDPYTKKPYVQFYTTKRVGGMINDSNAIKLMKIKM